MNNTDKLIKNMILENEPSENLKRSIKVDVLSDREVIIDRERKRISNIYDAAFKNLTKLKSQ